MSKHQTFTGNGPQLPSVNKRVRIEISKFGHETRQEEDLIVGYIDKGYSLVAVYPYPPDFRRLYFVQRLP